MKQTDRLRLEEVLRRISYLKDVKENEILINHIARAAALRCLKAIGEAVAYYETNPENSFSQEMIENYPQIPFTQIARIRHDLTHYYFFLFHNDFKKELLNKVENIIFKDLPILKEQLQIILKIEDSEKEMPVKPKIKILQSLLFSSVLPSRPEPLMEKAVELPKKRRRHENDNIQVKFKPRLTSADYLSIALLEIEDLDNICQSKKDSLNEEMINNPFTRFAIENYIENIIQAIKDSQDTRLLDRNDNKASLIMRIIVTQFFIPSRSELSLFYTDFARVRDERIAHNIVDNYFSEGDLAQKQAHVSSLLEFVHKITEFVNPIKLCISKLGEGYLLKEGPVVPRFIGTLSSKLDTDSDLLYNHKTP